MIGQQGVSRRVPVLYGALTSIHFQCIRNIMEVECHKMIKSRTIISREVNKSTDLMQTVYRHSKTHFQS